MPGPAVFVVAAAAVVGTVAAAIAFKEFVYEPHIAPRFAIWSAAMTDQSRRNRARQAVPVAVPAMSEARPKNKTRSSDKKDSDDHDNDGMSVELEDLVAKEVAEWKSTSAGPHGTLRQRKPKSGNNVLDESNVFLPFDPISPTQLTTGSSGPSSPAPGPSKLPSIKPSSPPIIHSPLPRAPRTFSVSIPPSGSSPDLSTATGQAFSVPAASSRTPSALSSRTASTSPSDAELSHSASSSSSFTPAVIGPRSGSSQYGAYDDVFSLPSSGSTSPFVDVNSPPTGLYAGANRVPGTSEHARSDAGSPFTDIHAVAESPRLHPQVYMARSPSPVILSPGMVSQSSLHVASESDMAILSPSLRSGMFSPTLTNSSVDPFDDASDLSSWESVGRRTPDL